MTTAEINAAKALANEIGIFQWLEAIERKGQDNARMHIGMTVQRAIEIMQSFGLDPYRYGFICFDEWDEKIISHDTVFDQQNNKENPDTPREVLTEAWDEITPAGERYSFRPDQLLLFIARGFEERLKLIEEKLSI
jgi:hypothetical protein